MASSNDVRARVDAVMADDTEITPRDAEWQAAKQAGLEGYAAEGAATMGRAMLAAGLFDDVGEAVTKAVDLGPEGTDEGIWAIAAGTAGADPDTAWAIAAALAMADIDTMGGIDRIVTSAEAGTLDDLPADIDPEMWGC